MTEMITQGIVGDLGTPQTPGSIGHPSLGYGIRVMNDEGEQVLAGQSGHLQIKGVPGLSIFAEYYRDPKSTAETFTEDGWFRTGDVVTVHKDGSIQFSDRAKDVIKVGGENVSSAEVERVISGVPGIRECAVVAKPDSVYGEVVAAYVTLHDGTSRSVSEQVIARCRTILSKFKVPREVIVIDEMPRANVGKISKAELRRRLKERDRLCGS